MATEMQREADAARERKQIARDANKAMDAERADRVAAHGTSPRKVPMMKSVNLTPRAAAAPPPPPPETQVSTESLATACTKATKTCVIA